MNIEYVKVSKNTSSPSRREVPEIEMTMLPVLRIVLIGSSSSLTVSQRGNGFSAYNITLTVLATILMSLSCVGRFKI